jgi:hypothetical protein
MTESSQPKSNRKCINKVVIDDDDNEAGKVNNPIGFLLTRLVALALQLYAFLFKCHCYDRLDCKCDVMAASPQDPLSYNQLALSCI